MLENSPGQILTDTESPYAIITIMKKPKHPAKIAEFTPKTCWVGEQAKIIYASEVEAELAARVAEYQHHLPASSLKIYSCPYGNHFHLSRAENQGVKSGPG